MSPEPDALSIAQIDALLAFLPIFERPGYSFGEWRLQRGVFPHWAESREAGAFVEALYRERFIIAFDWGSWGPEVQRYLAGGAAALAEASLTDLRKLLTAHVRADRFVAGTMASHFSSGHIADVLRRLRQIRDALAAE